MDNSVWIRLIDQGDFVPGIIICAVVAIGIISATIIKIMKMWITHNERVIMIQHGIHPDCPPENKDEG
jgi:hypothetical protein